MQQSERFTNSKADVVSEKSVQDINENIAHEKTEPDWPCPGSRARQDALGLHGQLAGPLWGYYP